ncbi:unnamed protein product, partial [Closterium sp. Yama58-4]
QVLLDFQQAWGRYFPGWEAGGDCSLAYHVDCDDQGMVTYMDLGNNTLSGSIPSIIGNVSNLVTLSLFSNILSGSIPSTFGYMSRLTYLSLAYNNLTGPIPSTIGYMSSLTYL